MRKIIISLGITAFLGIGVLNAQTYDTTAISVINSLIDNNGLTGYTKDDPDNWDFAEWDNSTPKQLIELDFWSFDISLTGSVSFTRLTNLEYLDLDESNLTQLDVSGLTKLETLYCSDNNLTQLNVSGCTSLSYLICDYNNLTQLDASGLANLEVLVCENNNLTQLNVSNCAKLELLVCTENNLTQLNVSGLTSLQALFCNKNNLTQLNVSGCVNLEALDCEDNHLTALDLTGLNGMLLNFLGDDQTVSLALQESTAGKFTHNISLNKPTFSNSAISYSSGVLTSNSNTVTSTDFSVETGLSGFELSGTMYFTYGSVGIVGANGIRPIQVYPNPTNGKIRIEMQNAESNMQNIEIYDIYGRKLSHFTIHLLK